MKNLSLICAAADNSAIGREGGIPWHISADFKYFKSVTSGHSVIMGRGTWDSMGKKPLPNRRNIVVSRNLPPDGAPGAEVFPNLESALGAVSSEEEIFVIGGGSLYRQAMDLAEKIYLTQVHTVIESADTFFPVIDSSWKETSRSGMQHDEKSGLDFEFVIYEKH